MNRFDLNASLSAVMKGLLEEFSNDTGRGSYG
jgi:hypothetical protein